MVYDAVIGNRLHSHTTGKNCNIQSGQVRSGNLVSLFTDKKTYCLTNNQAVCGTISERMMNRYEMAWWSLTIAGVAAMLLTGIALFGGGSGFMLWGFVTIVTLGVRDLVCRASKLDERQEAMRKLASDLEFTFRESAPVNVLGWSDTFELTRHVTKISDQLKESDLAKWMPWFVPKSRNVMERFIEDIQMVVFDCPIPKNDVETWHTVIALKSPDLEMPHLAVHTKSIWDNVAAKLQQHVSVHENFRVNAESPQAFEVVSDQLVEWLGDQWSLEVGEGFLLLYRRDKTATPMEIDEMIRRALEIHAVFAERPGRASDTTELVS